MHPLKPRLAFRVGVVGHRPNRLQSADLGVLSDRLRELLSAVRGVVETFAHDSSRLFSDGAPVLRALSPLAEGTDRLFADAALGLGYHLCCPMPFPQAEFEKDFTPPHALEPDSLARFRAILERAEKGASLTRFEMDGDRADVGEAYGACGHVLLNQSDLLVVVWDGQWLGKPGGTEDTFDEARRKGVPIVWVDAHAPHDWQLLDSTSSLPPALTGARQMLDRSAASAGLEQLKQTVRHALEVPTQPESQAPHRFWNLRTRAVTIEHFLAERKPRMSHAFVWIPFRNFTDRWTLSAPPLRVKDFEADVEQEWPRDQSSPLARVIDRLRPFYAWSDKLAVSHSDAYRSAFVFAYLTAALAVAMALLPLAFGWAIAEPHAGETRFIWAELLMIFAILFIVALGRHRGWHERWLDYRLVAELVRHLRLVAPLGGGRPFPQVPAQWAGYGRPASTWMAWYVRAVERDLGLPTATLDRAHITACVKDLISMIQGQIDFHRTNAARSHRIEQKLYGGGLLLFALTIAACAAHLLHGVMESAWAPATVGSLVFLCGFLPALGAAFAGISNQAEFRRVAKRSGAMLEQLNELKTRADAFEKQIDSTSAGRGHLRLSWEATQLATSAAQLMVNEVLDWRVVFIDQPLKTS